LSLYDHVHYPGVVPRTFLGPLSIATIVSSLRHFFITKFPMLLISRFTLGLLTWFSLRFIRNNVQEKYGKFTAILFHLFTLSQFHILFWGSRTLPNTFAFVLTSLAFGFLIKGGDGKYSNPIFLLTLATVIFRSEVLILSGCIFLIELLRKKVNDFMYPNKHDMEMFSKLYESFYFV
jgi:alpha-1,6-mannosyltransferase